MASIRNHKRLVKLLKDLGYETSYDFLNGHPVIGVRGISENDIMDYRNTFIGYNLELI